jgi:ABC-type phosphate transport system substrate-binding protein
MRRPAHALVFATCLLGCFSWSARLEAADVLVKMIAHPSRSAAMTVAKARAIYLKQRLFWDDGEAILPINLQAGSEAREIFSQRVFGQSSRRLATYWNQRYFEAGEFPPATLASEEAVVRFVSDNPNAVGYVTSESVGDSVVVVLVLE